MYYQQRTLVKPVSCIGIGVHSGKNVNLTIKPAPVNHGIKFVRTDLPDKPRIPAIFKMVLDTSLATVIGRDGFIISTIEHLMASFSGFSIDNALVELDGHEMPIMDGSAARFTELIKKAGIKKQMSPRCFFVVKKPIALKSGGKSVEAYPASTFKITCTIGYDHPLIKKQSYTIDMSDDTFETEISGARTFGFLHEHEYMKRYGLGKGASLENCVVIGKDNVLNEDGLRWHDEFVRHKLLDCIGDFSLLGMPILGHIITNKSGHAFNHAFIQEFFAQKKSWETRPMHDFGSIVGAPSKSFAI